MERGQLDKAVFSERSGLQALTVAQLIGGMVLREDIIHKAQNKAAYDDPWRVDDDRKTLARALLETLNQPTLDRIDQVKLGKLAWAANLRATMQALRQGPDGAVHPAAADVNALLMRHPDAALTFTMAEHDPLYGGSEQSRRAAERFLGAIAHQSADVRVMWLPHMTHAYHTYFPQIYHAIRAQAMMPRAS
jgi:hypothetical protein